MTAFLLQQLTPRRLDAPKLSLDVKLYHATSDLSITSSIRIDLVLRREQDEFDDDFVFVWNNNSAFKRCHFELLHVNGDVLERVDVRQGVIEKRILDQDEVMKVHGWNDGLEQLRHGQEQRIVPTLPDRYHELLVVGERYRLMWAGQEIQMWDWGTKRGFVGKELTSQAMREEKQPRLVLPASAGVEFTVREEAEPWPRRAEILAKYSLHTANSMEAQWRREQNPPPSPRPISPSQRGQVCGLHLFVFILTTPID